MVNDSRSKQTEYWIKVMVLQLSLSESTSRKLLGNSPLTQPGQCCQNVPLWCKGSCLWPAGTSALLHSTQWDTLELPDGSDRLLWLLPSLAPLPSQLTGVSQYCCSHRSSMEVGHAGDLTQILPGWPCVSKRPKMAAPSPFIVFPQCSSVLLMFMGVNGHYG